MDHLPSNMFSVWRCKLNTFYSFLTFVLRCHTVSRNFTVKYSKKVGQVPLRRAGAKYTGPNPRCVDVKLLKDVWYSVGGDYAVFCDVTSCALEESYQRIETTRWLHFQGWFFFLCHGNLQNTAESFTLEVHLKVFEIWGSGTRKNTMWILYNEEYVSLMLFDNVIKGTL